MQRISGARDDREDRLLFPFAAILVGLLFTLVVFRSFTLVHVQQYVLFAESLLEGRIDFVQELAPTDEPATYQGRHYLPLGPAPGMLLLPFAALARALGGDLLQGHLNVLLVPLVFWLARALALRAGLARRDAFYLAAAYTCASPFYGTASIPISNYFAHVLVTALLLWALLEYAGRRRPWLIGCLLAFVIASRLTAGLGIAFFVFAFLTDPERSWQSRCRATLAATLPVALALGLLLLYNAARFGDPLETGYGLQAVLDPPQQRARAFGLLSWRHVPGNLYYMLLAPPRPVFEEGTFSVLRFPFLRPDYWGMSLFATAPWLAWLFAVGVHGRESRLLLATALGIAAALSFTWSMGYAQFGYRFSLDFLPYLYALLLAGLSRRGRRLGPGLERLIVVSICVDAYLLEAYLGLG